MLLFVRPALLTEKASALKYDMLRSASLLLKINMLIFSTHPNISVSCDMFLPFIFVGKERNFSALLSVMQHS